MKENESKNKKIKNNQKRTYNFRKSIVEWIRYQNTTQMEGKTMKIAIGCDPNATEYKTILTPFIESLGHECVDFGSDDPIYANTESVWLRL